MSEAASQTLPGTNLHVIDRTGRAERAASWADVWALVLPAVSFIEITVVGRLIVTELLLVALLPWLWSQRDRLPVPRWFVVLWAGWLLGQVVTDIVTRTLFSDF